MLATAQFATPATTFLFARGSDRTMWYRQIEGGVWKTEWKSLGGNFLSQPAAASMRDGRVDVYAIWADQTTWFKTYQNGIWHVEWMTLGGSCGSPPVVCSLTTDSTNLVLVGVDYIVY